VVKLIQVSIKMCDNMLSDVSWSRSLNAVSGTEELRLETRMCEHMVAADYLLTATALLDALARSRHPGESRGPQVL
jgi:hypothetical protein